MKTALAMTLALVATAFAQDRDRVKPPAPGDQNQQNKPMKKLNSVTWDLQTHKLVWTVESGQEVNGKFVASGSQKYEISPKDAVMQNSNEKRGFTTEEAASLQHLLDVLSLYCAESVVWWDQGHGVPLDQNGVPKGPAKTPEDAPKPKKVETLPAGVQHALEVASLSAVRR